MSVVLTILILVFTDCITFWIIGSPSKSNRLKDKSHLLLILNECGNISATFTVLTSSFLDPHYFTYFYFFILDTTQILPSPLSVKNI